MAGKMNSKVRLVRCPKCRLVLPEPPNVPVYTCGGCGTNLQAKKRINSPVDTASQRPDEGSSSQQLVLKSTDDSDKKSDHIDLDSSNKDQESAKRDENGTVDAPSSVVEEHTSEKLKIKQLSDNQEPCFSSNQQLVLNSSDEPDQKIHNDPCSSTELLGHEDPDSSPEAIAHNRLDQEQDKHQENVTVVGLEHSSAGDFDPMNELDRNNERNDPRSSTEFSGHEDPESSPEATAHKKIDQQVHGQNQKQDQSHCKEAGEHQENVVVVGLKDSSSKQKTELLCDDNGTGNRFAQLFLVNPMYELDRNNDRGEHHSSSELSYHNDQESSPEATVNTSVKQHETQLVSCRKETEIKESGDEFEETVANRRVISDSDGGSKSSFRSMIAEKLLDARPKKHAYLDEDDLLSEDGSADLRPRGTLGRISSVESMETARPGGISYYGYEGSVSSFDGNDDQVPRKNHIGSKRDDEHVDSGHRYRFNRRNDQPLNGFHENPRQRPYMIPENPKMERAELLKLVQELQVQLERTNISNPPQVPSYCNHILNNRGRYGQRMAFSGEATAVNRRLDGSSCHHCCPPNRHFSAQLPSHNVCCSGRSYGSDSYRSPHFSGASSPIHNRSGSDFSAADDQWQQNNIRKRLHSPKKKKRYVRPVAGGSPWITCYRCFKLLELPQSFLLFNKRYHSLKCGACLRELNFTLSDRTHVSRYYPEEMIAAPPSSEVEDNDKLAGSWARPVSYSDRSFEKSYSTETDRNGSRSRELSEERRKATMSRDPSGSTRPPSSRRWGRRTTTSEIEEVGPGQHNGSPLHWLMGYASPSKVIRG